jgi:putative Holliday junction resolvase
VAVWIGVDVGTVRVGVARSDPSGVLASPLVTLARDETDNADIVQLASIVRESQAAGVVVGLPQTLRGREGPSAQLAKAYAAALRAAIEPIPVHLLDERLTTVSAERKLRSSRLRGQAKRRVIDQAAAVELLQHWLDMAPA